MKAAMLFNYTAQLYSAFALLFVVPLYISNLGAEAYGLIAFFIMLQAWSQILEAGVSGSVTRLVAVSKNNRISFHQCLGLCHKIIFVFTIIAIIMTFLGFFVKDYLSLNWFKTTIDPSLIEISVMAMFLSLSFKYVSGPFRSILVGLERHVEISLITIFVLTFRYPLSILFIAKFSSSIDDFFIYQVVVSFIELCLYLILSKFRVNIQKKLMFNAICDQAGATYSFYDFFKFSFLLSVLSVSWVVVTQIDKLVLSKFISLIEYGYYSLAVSLSGAILFFSAPLNQILMPKLTSLYNSRNEYSFYKLFFTAFLGVSAISLSLSLFLFLFGREVIYVWTGDWSIAEEADSYLGFLSMGNAISVLMSMVFMLLFAKGDLKQHTIIYVIYSGILIPLSIYVAYVFGGYGASIFWFIHNFLLFIFWGVAVLDKNFEKSTAFIFIDILLPCSIISVVNFYVCRFFVSLPSERLFLFIFLFLIGLINLVFISIYFLKFNYKTRSLLLDNSDGLNVRLYDNE